MIGISEANLRTFLPRFSLRKFDRLWKALGMAKLPHDGIRFYVAARELVERDELTSTCRCSP